MLRHGTCGVAETDNKREREPVMGRTEDARSGSGKHTCWFWKTRVLVLEDGVLVLEDGVLVLPGRAS